MRIEYKSISTLTPYLYNPRINDHAVKSVANSIQEFGFKNPIIVDSDNEIIAGHTRLRAAETLGMELVPVIVADDLTEDQVKAFRLADNKTAEIAEWDMDLLQGELEDIEMDMEQFEFEDLGDIRSYDYDYSGAVKGSLAEDFIIPPMTILNSRDGKWQERKKHWADIGIRSEIGRNADLIFNDGMGDISGTSIFDPVLCEISYKWFTPKDGSAMIFDPFAGGSVRGVVAERTGNEYMGIDLRNRQVIANISNANEIGCDLNKIQWICDDSLNMDEHIEDGSMDLVFTCPPYYDLEVYSDDEADLSNMDHEEFDSVYSEIISNSMKKLKDDRFAVIVVGNVRDKQGYYKDLVGLTTEAAAEGGAYLYNDMILATVVGTGSLRARKNMRSRKVVKTHQNVLVYYKGDPRNINEVFGEFESSGYIEELD